MKKLKIGPVTVKIREALPSEIDSSEYGKFSSYGPDGPEIVLQPGLDPKVERATLLHEALHAVFYCLGLTHLMTDEKEEFYCDLFAWTFKLLEKQI